MIWIFVKLPQEYWIHIAQLDLTDILAENAWAPPLLVTLLLALAAVFWFLVRPRLPAGGLAAAAGGRPAAGGDGHRRRAVRVARQGARLRSWATAEKVVLVGLITVIYGHILPGVEATTLELFVGIAVVVVVNAVFTLALARRSWSTPSMTLAFLARLLVNIALVVVEDWLLNRGDGDLNVGNTVFFMSMISLITTMHDRYRPVLATRVAAERAAASR